MKKILIASIVSIALFVTGYAQSDDSKKKPGKITAEEIVTKHLASIGTPEALAKVKSRVMIGEGRITGKVGISGMLGGPAQLASEGNKVLLAMVFNSNDYPYERVGFDGEDLSLGRPSGRRTELAQFLKSHSSIVKEGLFSGTLSSAWPLLNMTGRKVKLQYDGTIGSGDRQLHKLKYSTSRAGILNIVLYFDAVTFQHLMSEYKYTVEPGIRQQTNSRARPNYFTLIEQFSDFRKAGELTLPFSYGIDISAQTEDETYSIKWGVNVKEVYYNEPLEVTAFKVS